METETCSVPTTDLDRRGRLLLAGASLPFGASHPHPSEVQAAASRSTLHTQIGFTLSHMGFSNFTGRLSEATAPDLPTAIIPPAIVGQHPARPSRQHREAGWRADQRRLVRRREVPTITFTSTKVTVTGPGTAPSPAIDLHGVTSRSP